jgi:hypothetical protein
VSAVLPVNAPFLAADNNPSSPVPEGGVPFSEDSTAYLSSVAQKLNEASPQVYTPDLGVLDNLVRSLQVQPTP